MGGMGGMGGMGMAGMAGGMMRPAQPSGSVVATVVKKLCRRLTSSLLQTICASQIQLKHALPVAMHMGIATPPVSNMNSLLVPMIARPVNDASAMRTS